MGIYYYFTNITRNEENLKSLFEDASPMAKFNNFNKKIIADYFQRVIEINNWSIDDHIQAVPDIWDYPIIEYKNRKISFLIYEEEDYDY